MKKVKMFAIVFGLMLSVVGVSISKAPDTFNAKRSTDCELTTVDSDCAVGNGGPVCIADGVDARNLACDAPMRHFSE